MSKLAYSDCLNCPMRERSIFARLTTYKCASQFWHYAKRLFEGRYLLNYR